MKKITCFFIVFLIVFNCGCSNNNPKTSENEQSIVESQTTDTIQNQSIIMPNINVMSANWNDLSQKSTPVNVNGYEIMDGIGDNYWGVKSKYDSDKCEISGIELLMEPNSNKEIPFIYPANFPGWKIGSGSYVVLNNQYLFEWKS